MLPRQFALSLLGLLLSLWLVAGASAAPPIQATAQAARSIVQLGEPVRITIQVKDSDEIPQIDAPRIQSMSISSTGSADVTPSAQRNVRGIPSQRLPNSQLLAPLRDLSKQLNDASKAVPNGVDPQVAQQYQAMLKQKLGSLNRSDYSFVYLATPEKIGPITVPPFTVHSNGQTVQTRPIRLNVTEPRPSPWARAALSLSNPGPSVGDTLNLNVDLLVRRWVQQVGHDNANLKSQPISHVTLTVPALEGYQEIQPLEPLDQFVRKRRLPPGQLGYHINQLPGVILLEQEPVGTSERLDPHWYRRRLTLPFRAVQAGEMEIPPWRVAGEVYVPSGSKDRYTWEGFVTSSSPLKFRILDASNRASDPAPQPSRMTKERASAAQDSSTPAHEPSQGERANENIGAPWLHTIATSAATVVVFLAMVPVAIALRRRVVGRRQRIALVSHQRQTIEETRQRLQTASPTAADVSAAVQDFLRALLEMAPGEVTPEEAAERLSASGYPVELAQTCAAVLRGCAARQFAPSGTLGEGGDKDLARNAEQVVKEILSKN